METGYSKGEVLKLFEDRKTTDLQIKNLFSDSNKMPDGIICASDSIAVRVIVSAMSREIRIQDDIAITGFYNTPWAKESPVPLASLDPHCDEIGKYAVELLTDSTITPPEIIKIKPTIIVRETTGGHSEYEPDTIQL